MRDEPTHDLYPFSTPTAAETRDDDAGYADPRLHDMYISTT